VEAAHLLRPCRRRSQILNVDGGATERNYLLTVPLLNLPGGS
jgi:hypothetical protein